MVRAVGRGRRGHASSHPLVPMWDTGGWGQRPPILLQSEASPGRGVCVAVAALGEDV